LRKFVGLLFVVLAAATAQAQGLSITFLDVGQGDAAVIRSPTGNTVLIDAGQSPTRVTAWLRRAKVDSLYLAIASHNHADHIGGMASAISTMPVRYYMHNGMSASTATFRRIMALLSASRAIVLRADPRLIDLGGGAVLRVLPTTPEARTQNDASIGLELTFGSFRALFTGDAEERQRAFWRSDSIGAVHLLKVSHHGSENGTDPRWLAPLSPCAAVISVGARNSFGHPSLAVLQLLASARVATYRTDYTGQVTVVADSSGAFRVSAGEPARVTSFKSTCRQKR
jgi:competence protein ComEC